MSLDFVNLLKVLRVYIWLNCISCYADRFDQFTEVVMRMDFINFQKVS